MYPHKATLKDFKKKYQENAYLTVKNARASRALRQALDPGGTNIRSLCSPNSTSLHRQNLGKKFWDPLDQILDPLVMI